MPRAFIKMVLTHASCQHDDECYLRNVVGLVDTLTSRRRLWEMQHDQYVKTCIYSSTAIDHSLIEEKRLLTIKDSMKLELFDLIKTCRQF